ncbi:MAG: Lrp/AsnC family transcriptional regulator [Euryarchaeota archaeon]|nr:Lrp/AsnC family transcriptional regulator [Euryarchaeota archaeon]
MSKILKKNPTKSFFDDTDRKLVQMLQEDGRASDSALARATGTSNDTARRRRERLVKSGVLRIKAQLDPKKLGYVHFLHLAVATRPQVGTRAFAEKVSRDRNAYYVALSMGPEQRVLIHYRGRTEEELYDYIERLRRDPQVERVEANVIFEVLKVSYHSVDLERE